MYGYLDEIVKEQLIKEAEDQILEDLLINELMKEAAEERQRSILPYVLGGAGLGLGGLGALYYLKPEWLERGIEELRYAAGAPMRALRSRVTGREMLRMMGRGMGIPPITGGFRRFLETAEEMARKRLAGGLAGRIIPRL